MVASVPFRVPTVRRRLSADGLYGLVRSSFDMVSDHRHRKAPIALADALMSALAMFSLKDPSLLAFDVRRSDRNMKALFGIEKIPSDTQMREILDEVNSDELRSSFVDVFREVQRGKSLQSFMFYQGYYLLALDGTGYFSSQKIHCDSCLQKVNEQTGEITYQHQMLGAVIIHPDYKEVIPLAPEPIQKQDGDNKNDCERNAAKRLLQKIRMEHPRLKLIVVEDGLASNGPHIRELLNAGMHFILGVKPSDHPFLFEQVIQGFEEDRVTRISWKKGDVLCEIEFLNELPLNESNQVLLVNFLQFAEYGPDGHRQKYFTWVTDFRIARDNAQLLVRGGRCRWRIENETFNTLKNQGYHYEHNYGHGQHNLSVVFAMLMMLAFLIDQVQQLCCPLFRAVWEKLGSKRALWDNLRSHFRHFLFRSMWDLYEAILYDRAKEAPLPIYSYASW